MSNIRLPIIRLETVELVSMLNDYIKQLISNEVIITEELMDEIFQKYKGTQTLKFFETAISALRNAIRNSRFDLYPIIENRIRVLHEYLTSQERISAISLLRSVKDDIQRSTSVERRDGLESMVDDIIKTIKSPQTILSTTPSQDDHIHPDMRFSAVLDSMIELVGELQQQENGILEESVKRKIGTAVRRTRDKVTSTIVRYSLREKEMSERLNEKFNRFIKEYRDNKKLVSYDKIVKDSINLSRMLRNLVGSSIFALLIPGGIPVKMVTAILSLLVKFAWDKRTDEKHKRIILNDLKFEQRIIQEKIRDAESRADIKAKYKLMRTENEIARAIDRIKFNIKN